MSVYLYFSEGGFNLKWIMILVIHILTVYNYGV